MKNSRATSCVHGLNGEKTNVSRTISVLVFRVLMCHQTVLEKFFRHLTN
jgi:hypothetical protein